MREIKFRAWNKRKNIMCYGNEDNSKNYWDGYCNSIVDTLNDVLNEDGGQCFYEFMQYTGLKDKNGKEIYEGDIVRLKMKYEDDEDIIGTVKFGTFLHSKCREYTCYHYGYYVDYKWQGNTGYDLYDAFINVSIEYCEVIGNIYDNPELLD